MTTISAEETGKQLHRLLEEVSRTHEPIRIASEHGNVVLVAEEDWRSAQETLHLLSIPGMRESIVEGVATPVHELEDDLDW